MNTPLSLKKYLKKITQKKLLKIGAYSFLLAFFFISLLIFIYWPRDFSRGKTPVYGLNFSQKYASQLGLNWKEVFLAILEELKPQKIRISAHWDKIEKNKGVYNFSDLDWQIKKAQEKNIKIILAIGQRTPRWPECHPPRWAQNMPNSQKQKYILKLIEQEVNHFKKFDNIIFWQVENEPLLNIFGKCPKGDKNFLEKEISLVKSLDNRPIVLTDSGELSTWYHLSQKADILGTSMYRTVWNPYWGFFTYPLPASFYYYKAKLVKFFNKKLQKVIITELQGEAWANANLNQLPIKEQLHSMNAQKLEKNIEYARRSGLPEIYIWGAEWWYWLKKQGETSLWETAKNKINAP